jgi:hypothetical protein
VRLVDVGDVPGAGLNPGAVEEAARDLRADAGLVRDGGNDVAGAWAGIGASYEAPEAGQLLRVMDPVRADTDRLADEVERVAAALATFAGELHEIAAKRDRLRVEVQELRSRVAASPFGDGSGFGWGSGFGSASGFDVGSGPGLDPALATQNAFLASRITSVTVELAEAERACAAAIRAIDNPPPDGGLGAFLADPVGTVAEQLPWGEASQFETCAGSAIQNVGMALWNGAAWNPFATMYPFLSTIPGVGPVAEGWNTAWTETGRSLVGWGVAGAEPGLTTGMRWSLDAADYLQTTGETLLEAADQKADGMLDWGAERLNELWLAGRDGAGWVIERASSGEAEINDDLLNAMESVAHLYEVSAGADDGGFPRTGEVLTAGLGAIGTHIGFVHTAITFGQVPANLLDDGTGYAGEAKPVPDKGYLNEQGEYVGGVTDPEDLASVFQTMDDAYTAKKVTGEPTIRVTLKEPVDGGTPVAFVTIPGTEEWFPWQDNGNLRDVTADAVTAGGGRSAYADRGRHGQGAGETS